MPKPAIARRIAFEILQSVASGAFASELLIEQTAAIETRDAGLAAEITLGVLRRQGQLDWLIERYSSRPVSTLDLEVVVALRMAIYQICFLDRVPAYAAVNDSLNLLRNARKTSATGFANAILRKVSGSAALTPPDNLAVPPWLLAKWTQDFGEPTAHEISGASLRVPALFQHVPEGADPPEGSRPTEIPGCFQVETPDPRYRIQDIGSQAVIPLLGLTREHRFLDVCAAPGNKTAQALERTPHISASDLSLHRLRSLKTLGIPLVVADASSPLPFSRSFDRILVDAPCSGTGTLAHNPEIKWRLEKSELARFAQRQKRILRNALNVLAPGGILVYSTCSLEPEENEQVVHEVAPSRVQSEMRRMPGRDPGDGFYAAVIG